MSIRRMYCTKIIPVCKTITMTAVSMTIAGAAVVLTRYANDIVNEKASELVSKLHSITDNKNKKKSNKVGF